MLTLLGALGGLFVFCMLMWLLLSKRKIKIALGSSDPSLLVQAFSLLWVSQAEQRRILNAMAAIRSEPALRALRAMHERAVGKLDLKSLKWKGRVPWLEKETYSLLLSSGDEATFRDALKILGDKALIECDTYSQDFIEDRVERVSLILRVISGSQSLMDRLGSENSRDSILENIVSSKACDTEAIHGLVVRLAFALPPFSYQKGHFLDSAFLHLRQEALVEYCVRSGKEWMREALDKVAKKCDGRDLNLGVDECRQPARSWEWRQVLEGREQLRRLVLAIKETPHRDLLSRVASLPDQKFKICEMWPDEDIDGNRQMRYESKGALTLDLSEIRRLASGPR